MNVEAKWKASICLKWLKCFSVVELKKKTMICIFSLFSSLDAVLVRLKWKQKVSQTLWNQDSSFRSEDRRRRRRQKMKDFFFFFCPWLLESLRLGWTQERKQIQTCRGADGWSRSRGETGEQRWIQDRDEKMVIFFVFKGWINDRETRRGDDRRKTGDEQLWPRHRTAGTNSAERGKRL